jgi:hypothetical protein
MKSILDPSFRYTASFNTNLQKTFARIRRDQQQEAESAALSTPGALPTYRRLSEIRRQARDEASGARRLVLAVVPIEEKLRGIPCQRRVPWTANRLKGRNA